MSESDTHLVGRALARDTEARDQLVCRYLQPAFAVALSVLRNVADAEDVAQESLLIAIQRLHQCRERFGPWLLQSVRFRALTHVRQTRVRRLLLEGCEPAGMTRFREPFVERNALLSALDALTVQQQAVVLLHDLEAWTHGEIATALGISEVMSRQHLFLARKDLRVGLSKGV